MINGRRLQAVVACGLLGLCGLLAGLGVASAQHACRTFGQFSARMAGLLPCAFVLVGLFEVWVKRETVEKHLGRGAGLRGHGVAIVLAGTTIGGLLVALPLAAAMRRKGAGLAVVFTYLGASALCRLPMVAFEATFLGLRFSLARLLVSVPMVVVTSVLLGRFLEERGYELREP